MSKERTQDMPQSTQEAGQEEDVDAAGRHAHSAGTQHTHIHEHKHRYIDTCTRKREAARGREGRGGVQPACERANAGALPCLTS